MLDRQQIVASISTNLIQMKPSWVGACSGFIDVRPMLRRFRGASFASFLLDSIKNLAGVD